jgi:hypothetical protein
VHQRDDAEDRREGVQVEHHDHRRDPATPTTNSC